MKILIREHPHSHEQYVWKDAKWDGNFKVDGVSIAPTNIVSIVDDDRTDFVRCSSCGAIFRKDSPEIEQHKHAADNSEACMTCRYKRERERSRTTVTYEKTADNEYVANIKSNVHLYCNRTWSNYGIDTQEARAGCVYARCKNATMATVSDVFTKYPGAFDDLITVDKIIEAGYTDRLQCSNYAHYKLKAKNAIYAHVNAMNIVDHFRVTYYSHYFDVVYSKKYDLLFVQGYGGDYKNSSYLASYMPDATIERIKKKIASLYD